jgi:hypothetical protein
MKKNTNEIKNVHIFAENDGNISGFNIYLDFSGKREFLVKHRHNGLLYPLLKDGIQLDALLRWEVAGVSSKSLHIRGRQRKKSERLANQVYNLIRMVDEYITGCPAYENHIINADGKFAKKSARHSLRQLSCSMNAAA